jgi:glycosyltransferase involved in cell wall biosynthesis
LRVLLVPAWYPTPRYPMGGVFCQEQARALRTDPGLDARVLFVDRVPLGAWRRGSAQRGGWRCEAGVPVYRTAMPRVPGLWPLLYIPWVVAVGWRLARRGFRPDVIHAQISLPAGLAGGLLAGVLGVPWVLTEHTCPFAQLMRNPLAAFATTRTVRAATRVVAVSRSLREEMWAYPRLRRRIAVIPNVVDTTMFAAQRVPRTPGEPARLLFVGHMETPVKGVNYLLEAVARLQAQGIAVRLDLAGGGRLQAGYEAEAARLGVAERCTFHGVLPPEAVAGLLAASDLLVLPSLAETFGVVLIEALAAGVPVVATRCGGPEDVVTPDVGRLVAPGDVDGLIGAIAAVLTTLPEFPAAHLRAVAERRYGQGALARRLSALYRQMVARA